MRRVRQPALWLRTAVGFYGCGPTSSLGASQLGVPRREVRLASLTEACRRLHDSPWLEKPLQNYAFPCARPRQAPYTHINFLDFQFPLMILDGCLILVYFPGVSRMRCWIEFNILPRKVATLWSSAPLLPRDVGCIGVYPYQRVARSDTYHALRRRTTV